MPSGCRVSYQVNARNTGYTANVTIGNWGANAVNGWTLRFTLPAGQRIEQAWSSQATQSGQAVTLTNAPWNATIPVGGNVQIGFNASHTGSATAPTSFTLNGMLCG